MIYSLLRRWADASLARENSQLHQSLAEERSKLRIADLENERLLEVIERDRRRVAAETAIFARRQADAESKPHSPNYGL